MYVYIPVKKGSARAWPAALHKLLKLNEEFSLAVNPSAIFQIALSHVKKASVGYKYFL